MNAAAQREHLLDQPRADVGVLLGGHHEHRFYLRVQPPIHQRHLELEFEGRHRTEPADNHLGAASLDAYTEVKSVWIDTGNKIDFRTGPTEGADAI